MTAIETVCTLYSTYEVDWDGRRIRRMDGINNPTPWQGEDGLWQNADVTVEHDGALLIDWLDKPGVTLTSPAVPS